MDKILSSRLVVITPTINIHRNGGFVDRSTSNSSYLHNCFKTTTIDVGVPSVYTLSHREPTKPLLIPDPNFEP